MVNLSHCEAIVNVSGPSTWNDVNNPFASDWPEDIDIHLYNEDPKGHPMFCPSRYHMIYKALGTGKETETETYEQKKMLVHDTQRRSAIVLADLRSCKRDSAYDIFKLNGPDADIEEILTNPHVGIYLIWFHVPTYFCPFCNEANHHNPDQKPKQHYHRAVPEWMIWKHVMTMLTLLLIVIKKVKKFLKEMDSYTASGWIREGNRIWGQVTTNSLVENLVEEIDPERGVIKDGETCTVFWIYYMIPPWMRL